MTEPKLDRITADAMRKKMYINRFSVTIDNEIHRVVRWKHIVEILNSLVSEDEGFTKPCTCGSTMHLQHHWECLNCKKGTKESGEEITLEEAKSLKSATLHNGKWYAGIIVDFPKTDEEISLLMWEEYCDEIYSQAIPGRGVPTFPDWLKERK